MKKVITFVVAFAMSVNEAAACNRCGHQVCRIAVAQAVVAAPTPVYVVNNNYPSPLVAQGTSAIVSNGGYQSQVLPFVDPTLYFSQELQLVKAADNINALRSERASNLLKMQLQLQAPAIEKIAAGQAAAMALNAANSGVKVESSVTTQSITQEMTTSTSALNTFCASCHGTNLAQPKGLFSIGDDDNSSKLMKERFFKITQHIQKGTMPPAGAAQPSDAERRAIIDEITAIISKRAP